MWDILSRYGNPQARYQSYLPGIGKVAASFGHVAKEFMSLTPARRIAERHHLESILEWLEATCTSLDKMQRGAGWSWLVKRTGEWKALREAEIRSEAVAWPVPLTCLTVGRYELRPIDSLAGLWHEARAMHHCADTLANACATGNTLVVSVRDQGLRRTVATAWLQRLPEGWRCVQVRGIANRDPDPRVVLRLVPMISFERHFVAFGLNLNAPGARVSSSGANDGLYHDRGRGPLRAISTFWQR